MQTQKRPARAPRFAQCPRCARPLKPGASICYFCGFTTTPPEHSKPHRPHRHELEQRPAHPSITSTPRTRHPALHSARVRLRTRAPLAPLASSIPSSTTTPPAAHPKNYHPTNTPRSAIAAWPTQPQRAQRRNTREPSTAIRAAISRITTQPAPIAAPQQPAREIPQPLPITPEQPLPSLSLSPSPSPQPPAQLTRQEIPTFPLYRPSRHPLERLRWWLLRPGHIEFLLWIGGTFLLILITFILVLAMLISFGWLHTAPAAKLTTPDNLNRSNHGSPIATATATPTLTLAQPDTHTLLPGMPLLLHGQGFSRFAPVMFWFDQHIAFVDSQDRPVLIEADAQGRFTVTLHLLPSWPPGHHQIMAKDLQTKQIALLTITLISPTPSSQNSGQSGNGPAPTTTPGPEYHPSPTPKPSTTPPTPQPTPSRTPTTTPYPPTARPAPTGSLPPATATPTLPASPSLTPGSATPGPPHPSATVQTTAGNGTRVPPGLASFSATPPAPNENAQALPPLLCSGLFLSLPLLLLIARSRLLSRFLSHLLP